MNSSLLQDSGRGARASAPLVVVCALLGALFVLGLSPRRALAQSPPAPDAAPVGSAARAGAVELSLYKGGEVWPLTLVNGFDFLEPLFPAKAVGDKDAGRIVLDTVLPYTLLGTSFFKGTDHRTLAEIGRWHWVGVDQSQDNYPLLFGLCALAGASLLLPAPEDDVLGGYSIRLRLDRLTVFLVSIALVNGEVELLKPFFNALRPNGSSHASRPSGHSATAFAAMAFLSDVLRDTFRPEDETSLGLRIVEEVACGVPFLGAGYMALERVHGQKHFLTDTLLGGALGIFTTNMLYEWSFLRLERHASWADSFSFAYQPGGFEIAWSARF